MGGDSNIPMDLADPSENSPLLKLLDEIHKEMAFAIETNRYWQIADKPFLEKVGQAKKLAKNEVLRRREAESDVHRAVIACGQLCDGMEPTRNKYKSKN